MATLWLCIAFPVAFAQKGYPVTIQGTASFATNCEIQLTVFDDMLTYHKTVVAKDIIDKKGKFYLTYNAIQPQLVQISIRTSRAEFYVEPGRTYDFTIDMDPQLFEQLDPMAYGGFLQISNNDSTLKEDINLKINHFENTLDRVVDFYSPNIIGDMTPSQYDSIVYQIGKRFPIQYHPTNFYKSYIYYSLGAIEQIILQKYPDSLYHKYLDNEYILYENPAYMNFFTSFYHSYLLKSKKINPQELRKSINEEGSLIQLINVVGKDELLVNEKIRELVIILNLMQLYDNDNFNKENILSLLKNIELNSHFAEHRHIAADALADLTRFENGAPFSISQMKEASGAQFNPEKFKGKYVFLQFFNTTCTDCIREMMILQDLSQKYKGQIEFVSVSLDFHFSKFLQFKEKYRQFDWHFVHFNNCYDWLDEMGITTLPDNMLLNPDGTLYQRYAPDITRKLPLFLARLFNAKDDKGKPLDVHENNRNE